MLYTVVSAWICFYGATIGQFNWVISEHHRGPLLTVSMREREKMTQGCELIDYFWEEEK